MVMQYFLPDFNYEVIHYHHDTHINITCTGNSFPAYNFHPTSQLHITGIYFQTHDVCVYLDSGDCSAVRIFTMDFSRFCEPYYFVCQTETATPKSIGFMQDNNVLLAIIF